MCYQSHITCPWVSLSILFLLIVWYFTRFFVSLEMLVESLLELAAPCFGGLRVVGHGKGWLHPHPIKWWPLLLLETLLVVVVWVSQLPFVFLLLLADRWGLLWSLYFPYLDFSIFWNHSISCLLRCKTIQDNTNLLMKF